MARERGTLLAGTVACVLAIPATAGAATIEVSTAVDELDPVPDQACSLREAVESARTNSPIGGCSTGRAATDTIKLDSGPEYDLTLPMSNPGLNTGGSLDMGGGGGPVVIAGRGVGETEIGTSQADRLFSFFQGLDATFRKLTLSNGDVTAQDGGTAFGGNVRQQDGGDLTLDRVLVEFGEAFSGGGVYHSGEGKVTVGRSTFVDNQAGEGGGLAVNDGTATITRSLFQDNYASNAIDNAQGGGISNRADSMKIVESEIINNDAVSVIGEGASGGGVWSVGKLTIARSNISLNDVSAPTNNVFEGGGGVSLAGGVGNTDRITNTTFAINNAGDPDGLGGAAYITSGTVIMRHITFYDNEADDAGGNVYATGPSAYALVSNSIMEGSDPCAGQSIDSGNSNLASVDDPECDFHPPADNTTVSLFGVDTGVPVDNGGPTGTIKLLSTSPGLSFVPKASCDKKDQRGYKRPKGKRCDSGAFERGGKKP